ncbi:MAG: hypothetical protein AAF533_16555 [Acidobacteriota bacterium]
MGRSLVIGTWNVSTAEALDVLPEALARVGVPGADFMVERDEIQLSGRWPDWCHFDVEGDLEGDRKTCTLRLEVAGGCAPFDLAETDQLCRALELARSLHVQLVASHTTFVHDYGEWPTWPAGLVEDAHAEMAHPKLCLPHPEVDRVAIRLMGLRGAHLDDSGAVTLERPGRGHGASRCRLRSYLHAPIALQGIEEGGLQETSPFGQRPDLLRQVWPATSMDDVQATWGDPDQDLGGLDHQQLADAVGGEDGEEVRDEPFSFTHYWAFWELDPELVVLVRRLASGHVLPELATKS